MFIVWMERVWKFILQADPWMKLFYHKKFGLCLLFWMVLAACNGRVPLPPLEPTAVPIAEPITISLPTPLPTATAVTQPEVITSRTPLSVMTNVPADLMQEAQRIAQQHLQDYTWVAPEAADLKLVTGEGRPLAQWLYVVAAPFPTIEDGITLAELQTRWQTTEQPNKLILVTDSTKEAMTPILGQPGTAVHVVSESELATAVWQQAGYAILPFHKLTPALKVLHLDGVSPLAVDFDVDQFPLVLTVGLVGEETAVTQFNNVWDGPVSNYDPNKISRVAMTGVTALVRATATNMEAYGILWPGEDVRAVLHQADIAHLSNEVAFAPDCPPPNPIGGTTFCSSETYFALIEDLGADVIELTGNHQNDWGHDNFLYTIDMYEAAGLSTFGGGRQIQDAAQPALFEHHGNKIAFVGCNSFGPSYAWATETLPGSMPCDGSLPAQISQLKAEGYQVIATLQYTEFYHYAATAQQALDFQALIDAGATAVSGSQGHHAQAFDLYNGGFIHYGLGNLFFDQMDQLGTRQAFVDTYVFYDGRLISVELWTGLIENYARPREMTPDERIQALTAVFQASNWSFP